MQRKTAIKNAMTVTSRLRKCCGLIGTSGATTDCMKVRRAWIFGSTAKGSEAPNDLDVLLECYSVGKWRPKQARMLRGRDGARYKMSGFRVLSNYLSAGMKMIRIHSYDIDGGFGDIPQTKIMIYPRNDFFSQEAIR
jgi:hypothetical protein